jgi:hypothetical protein
MQALILEDFPSVQTVISPLKPLGNFMDGRFYKPKYFKYYIIACLWVSYDLLNKNKIFPIQGQQVRFITEMEGVRCAVRNDSMKIV